MTNVVRLFSNNQPMPDGTFTAPELCVASGATYRQVDFWTKSGLLRPTREHEGSGNPRAYDVTELSVAILMTRMVKEGLMPQHACDLARDLLDFGTATFAGMTIHLNEEP